MGERKWCFCPHTGECVGTQHFCAECFEVAATLRIDALLAQTRAAALEEAARICEALINRVPSVARRPYEQCAEAIRRAAKGGGNG